MRSSAASRLPERQADRELHDVYPRGENAMTNLQLTMLRKLGLPVEHFGDSTGSLKELTGLSWRSSPRRSG